MAESMLNVCWKGHSSEFATVYKSLLANNYLVDVTISAEGQNLNAHRLLLSACSPYFYKLFREVTETHPFVILLNASFETLKAVIDFVYQGETQIPEGNLRAFLTLAQSLQIKGLNAISKDYMDKNASRNTVSNAIDGLYEENQNSCEVEGASSHEDCPETSQHHSHHSEMYLDAVHNHSSVPREEYSASYEEVQSAPVMTPPRDQTGVGCNVSVDAEITVKCESSFSVFSETNEIVDNVESNELMSESFRSEECGADVFPFGVQNLNQYSSLSASSHRNVESSVITSPQQELKQLRKEVSSDKEVAETHQSFLPVILKPKSEPPDDAENAEPMEDYDVAGNYTDEGTEPGYDESHLNQSLTGEIFFPKRGRGSSKKQQLLKRKGARPPEDVRLHHQSHWPLWLEKRQRCKMPSCMGLTWVECKKCKVALCLRRNKNCFQNFHCK